MDYSKPNTNAGSNERLRLEILSSSRSKLDKVVYDDPRSKRVPFRLIKVKTGRLHEYSDVMREYGILSHVWYKMPNKEVTWDKLKDTSVNEFRDYLKDLEGFRAILKSTWDSLKDTEGERSIGLPNTVREPSDAIEGLLDTIEERFRIRFRMRKTERQTEGEIVENLLGKIGEELMFQNSLAKIAKALEAADALGLEYLWVDTCCMNKSSSAELMESISCMGEWYSNAKVCLVYLNDMETTSFSDVLTRLEWSTRGWTMQEIAMCKTAVFYNSSWRRVDNHSNSTTKEEICQISHLPPDLICIGGRIDRAASYIMHYAGKRKTTKDEDKAYSLMGMLGVKIPVQYGEGEEAALSRLIDEVVRSKGDVSVFNWTGKYSGSRLLGRSMYPAHLDLDTFSESSPKPVVSAMPVTISNAGVNMTFDILAVYPIFETVHYRFGQGLVELLKDVAKKHPDIDCTAGCKAMVLRGAKMNTGRFKVCCPLPILRREVEYVRNTWHSRSRDLDINSLAGCWVLARASGLELANWFLCLLELAPVSGYAGLRISSDKFRIEENMLSLYYTIQICVR